MGIQKIDPSLNMSNAITASLWLFVLAAGILAGGSIFEHVVLTPLWAGSPPDSVTQWPYGGIQSQFFQIVSPVYGLNALALLVLSWRMARREKILVVIAGLSGVAVIVATFVFFLPILQKTQVTRGAGLSGEEITVLVASFRTWNWARWMVLIGGWIVGIAARTAHASGNARTTGNPGS